MQIGRQSFGSAIIAVVVAVVVACNPKIIVVEGKLSDEGPRPECPHSWTMGRQALAADRRPMLASGIGGPVMLLEPPGALPGARTDVPEFHDCQRLRVWDEKAGRESYDSLAAVFARDSLEFLADSNFSQPVAVALVHLPQGGAYPILGLRTAYACVFVQRAPGQNEAWIVPVDFANVCQAMSVISQATGPSPYDLRVLDPPGGMSNEIPPVARWDWDKISHTQYIGVRCGNAWCEIGAAGFQSSVSRDPGPSATIGRAGYAFRGAYDEQRLAEFEGTTLVAAMNLGTVVPTDELAGLTTQRPPAGEWTPVARTHLAPTAGRYTHMFNFGPTATVSPAEEGASTVYLCMTSSTTTCPAMEWFTDLDIQRCTAEIPGGERWIARVELGGRNKYFCVLYREHPTGFTIPAVVRWRWRANDETIWVSCPSGCCEVNAKR